MIWLSLYQTVDSKKGKNFPPNLLIALVRHDGYETGEFSKHSGPWFNIKMLSYQYRKSHCGDKTVVRLSYLYNGISYTGKMSSLYWIGALLRCRRLAVDRGWPLIARFMGPTRAHMGPKGPRWAPCLPHEPCSLGMFVISIDDLLPLAEDPSINLKIFIQAWNINWRSPSKSIKQNMQV